MTRNEAYKILQSLISNDKLIKHHLACETAMISIYEYLQNRNKAMIDDEEKIKWGIVGLLHDADYEITKDNPQKHTLILEDKYGKEIPSEIMYAIKAHNYKFTNTNPLSNLDWALYTCDELTGLITACALIHPDKKLLSLDVDFIKNRFYDKSFAKGADRNQINYCEKSLNITLDDYIFIVLTAMQKISSQLGL